MQVFRIALAKYALSLTASGRAARWNPNDVDVIYTAGSRSLACLENVVHRNQIGLDNPFQVMTIEIPDDLYVMSVDLSKLPEDWTAYPNMPITQALGEQWVQQAKSSLLKVPSSIIPAESNYLINPKHADFRFIKLLKSDPFVFDKRIKM